MSSKLSLFLAVSHVWDTNSRKSKRLGKVEAYPVHLHPATLFSLDRSIDSASSFVAHDQLAWDQIGADVAEIAKEEPHSS
ncbi:hypothetical protein Cob_v009780 [Colletotrichum orbiculare MAFF 240422]|uniref:Uncharacterized protein n=1 Tax=Colletotrichum orbiculare (strain 104-T / ATCC 96160 / CBS 514.97 / LARS 414 / MAFF 240422) TaxID=1213857 RepID=A0A484FGM2_COLOR|nr:hypothetical protein Cob_v009780 [Colletotrichum orbiculare MAFF 240422]